MYRSLSSLSALLCSGTAFARLAPAIRHQLVQVFLLSGLTTPPDADVPLPISDALSGTRKGSECTYKGQEALKRPS